MKRWWLVMALMLSVGVNLGLLVSHLAPAEPAPAETVPAEDLPAETAPAEDVPTARRDTGDEVVTRIPVGSSPQSGPQERPRDRPLPQVMGRMADELGLEGEKRDQFLRLQRRFLERTVRARQEMQRSQVRIRHQLLAAHPERAVVRASLESMIRARAEMEKAFVENVLDTREILEPQQTRRYLQMLGRLRQSRDQFQQRLQQRRPGQRGERPWQRPQGPRRQRPADGARPDG